MTVETTGYRACWHGPVRSTKEEAQDDFDLVAAILLEHAPGMVPGIVQRLPSKVVPGAEACNAKTPG